MTALIEVAHSTAELKYKGHGKPPRTLRVWLLIVPLVPCIQNSIATIFGSGRISLFDALRLDLEKTEGLYTVSCVDLESALTSNGCNTVDFNARTNPNPNANPDRLGIFSE